MGETVLNSWISDGFSSADVCSLRADNIDDKGPVQPTERPFLAKAGPECEKPPRLARVPPAFWSDRHEPRPRAPQALEAFFGSKVDWIAVDRTKTTSRPGTFDSRSWPDRYRRVEPVGRDSFV